MLFPSEKNWPIVGSIASTLAQYSVIYGNTLGQFPWFDGLYPPPPPVIEKNCFEEQKILSCVTRAIFISISKVLRTWVMNDFELNVWVTIIHWRQELHSTRALTLEKAMNFINVLCWLMHSVTISIFVASHRQNNIFFIIKVTQVCVSVYFLPLRD